MTIIKMTKTKTKYNHEPRSKERRTSHPKEDFDSPKPSHKKNVSLEKESSHEIISYPLDLSKLISVNNKVVFIRDPEKQLLHAKLKLTNKSHRYVSFVVRPSNKYKFKIRPKYGYIPPHESLEIKATTKEACDFQAISREYFGIFAIPIYDKRLLEKQQLNILWRAQGTKMFPFEAAEFHRIAYVLPENDKYYDELSILGRIENMSFISRRHLPADGSDMAHDDRPVDEDTFFMNWPPPPVDLNEDPTMELLQKDWEMLTLKINNQTRNILDSLKTIVGMGVSIVTTTIAMYYLYSKDAPPFLGIGVRNGNECAEAETSTSFWDSIRKYVGL